MVPLLSAQACIVLTDFFWKYSLHYYILLLPFYAIYFLSPSLLKMANHVSTYMYMYIIIYISIYSNTCIYHLVGREHSWHAVGCLTFSSLVIDVAIEAKPVLYTNWLVLSTLRKPAPSTAPGDFVGSRCSSKVVTSVCEDKTASSTSTMCKLSCPMKQNKEKPKVI